MKQQSDWDKRVNELLNGINQIVNAVASMRNMNSDAHGVGTDRISPSESNSASCSPP